MVSLIGLTKLEKSFNLVSPWGLLLFEMWPSWQYKILEFELSKDD